MKELWRKTKLLWNPPRKPLHKIHDCRKAGCILGADGPVHGPLGAGVEELKKEATERDQPQDS